MTHPVDPLLPPSIAAVLAGPPRAFSPVAIWWWSGERLDRARLRAQLERFAQGGVHNLVLLNLAPSGPLFGSDADDPPFLSDAWWALLDGVCDDARELGVGLWFYDQLGFSGAGLQARLVDERPAHAGRRLDRVRAVVESSADRAGELRCPPHGRPLAGRAEPLDDDGRSIGPAVPVAVAGGVVRAPGAGRWRLTLHHHEALGFDYLGAEACAALLDRVHGEFERRLGGRLGSVVVGSFQDELPSLPTWSTGFADAFRRLRGYDITERLDALYDDSTDPDVHRIRRDYHLTRAELAEDAFFRPLAAWHERHGLLVGCDQQDPARAGHPVSGVELYADYARTHRWFSAPGSDHHGDARIHSSLAHLYGRPRTWVEAFHSTGWGVTLEETFDWLLPWLRSGATLYTPHAVYYTTKGGWWEWAPPATDWRQPYWRHHHVFADAVTRLCAILSLGHHLCDIAILLPTTTAQAGTALDGVTDAAARAQSAYLELVGDMAWFHTRPGVMDRLGLDADVVDDASLARARVARLDDGVRLCVADEAYTTIVLPSCTVLERETAERLVEFASAGGRLIAWGELPERVVGSGAATAADELWACFADGRAVHVPGADESADSLAAALGGVYPVVRAPVPALARRVDGATVVFLTAAAPRATRASVAAPDERGAALGWLDARYDFDPARYVRRTRVRVRDVAGPAVLVDPFGGAPRMLPVLPVADDARAVEVDVPFDTGPAAVLVFPGHDEEQAAPVSSRAIDGPGAGPDVTTVEIPPDAYWDMVLVPTLDNTWGDFARPATGPPTGTAVTECRTFRHRVEAAGGEGVRDGWAAVSGSGHPARATVHATFGPRAVVLREGAGRGNPSVVEWSETLGVYKDPVHRAVLGPKGHVPEEFVHIGHVVAGEVVRLRAALHLGEAFDGHLAIGAAAAKRARIDGAPVALDDGGHLAVGPVRVSAGVRLLELELTPDHDCELRAHLAFVRDAERYRRPEWIHAPGTMGTTLHLSALPARAVVQVAARVPCALRVNGQLIGRQGGFDPYAEHAVPRVRRHDVAAVLRIGDNDITVETSGGGERAVLVDAVLHDGNGEPVATLHSDSRWWAEGPRGRGPVRVRREPVGDPAALCLRRRPHPLPGAAWLEPEADDGTVVPVRFAVPGHRGGVEWLWCELPPGTTRLTVPVHGEVTVHVDGSECPAAVTAVDARGVRTVTVELPPGGRDGPRAAALRVRTRPGYEGGAALAGPVRCTVGPGRIRLGDWEGQGLAEYSGGVRYSRVVAVPADSVAGRVSLDLGRVRGTAEVRVGGVAAGVRVCSPYVFDLTGLVVPGANSVEITVFGTLAPHLDATSPTHFVFPGQRVSGLLGPVRLRTERV
ncbi:hypothetical protein OG978_06325 [Streptomyces sp. NBC_01591]|uniref:hypothetical protein n=1 Tax=Streptomyces sp. NBC_01591 TaxID=2975888 RepID=UPI002DDC69F8|nr:hypothetical protein [Streptomyces sp. NBC_01591]WSD67026.1 hypothetical protein OG978_06325 [Streptomyces sp. NBC_01591]